MTFLAAWLVINWQQLAGNDQAPTLFWYRISRISLQLLALFPVFLHFKEQNQYCAF